MTDWAKAIHPTTTLSTAEQALTATRASSIGMVVGAFRDAVLAWYTASAGAEATRIAVDQLTQSPESVEQMQAATQIGLLGAGFVVLLQLVLAVVHWRKLTSLLPLIFLMLVVWALGTGALALAYTFSGTGSGTQPLGMIMLTLLTMAAAAYLHAIAIRGAGRLAELRKLEGT